jgi:hypothetical protein
MGLPEVHDGQNNWRIEGREPLLLSRGSAMAQSSKSRSFNGVMTEPKEAASTV